MQFKVLDFEKLHTLRRHFKIFAGKHIVIVLLSLLGMGPTELLILSPAPSCISSVLLAGVKQSPSSS